MFFVKTWLLILAPGQLGLLLMQVPPQCEVDSLPQASFLEKNALVAPGKPGNMEIFSKKLGFHGLHVRILSSKGAVQLRRILTPKRFWPSIQVTWRDGVNTYMPALQFIQLPKVTSGRELLPTHFDWSTCTTHPHKPTFVKALTISRCPFWAATSNGPEPSSVRSINWHSCFSLRAWRKRSKKSWRLGDMLRFWDSD